MHGSIYQTPVPTGPLYPGNPRAHLMVKLHDARQPKATFTPKPGQEPEEVYMDPTTHKQIEKLIESNLMRTPAESLYQFEKSGSGIHLNIVTMPDNPNKVFIVVSNADGKVDIIEKGS